MKKIAFVSLTFALAAISSATTVSHSLASSNFTQDWTNTGQVTVNDNWDGVASIMGYRGDNLTAITGADPQTILGFEGTIDVNANQTNPDTFATGGITEFEITNPTIALQGSGTADAPGIVLYMNSLGRTNVTISYLLRDIDGSLDDTNQQIALQYRIGNVGDFTNVASAYVADATLGGSATLTTPISASLAVWDNVADLQFRILTSNAPSNDEWVGIDDISVSSTDAVPEPATMAVLAAAGLAAAARRKRK